jgi:hypothetical protein
MKQVEIRRKVRRGDYLYTLHAEIERKADDLIFVQIEKALLNGKILEQYPDSGRRRGVPDIGFR